MSARWLPMERDFWDHFAAQPTWPAPLSLFRTYDGAVLPFTLEDIQRVLGGKLPALQAEARTLGTQETHHGSYADQVEMGCGLVHSAAADKTRQTLELQAGPIMDLFDGRTHRHANWSSSVEAYEWENRDILAVRDPRDAAVRFWIWRFTVTLTGARRQVN